ncbi:hypothetical protein DNTS_028856 [Danionella cerebrum]|uniref:PHD-type domain-containing protein n=1 Tax=Danionella cerebrum TaxID=2873325 RepID=A0A553Q4X9_9TELE|nr:hypothetical protein DNTS_028856 [Danionella translucida]TRY84981.1 hypothetical protein DNTS_028856 [Danionella translucida]
MDAIKEQRIQNKQILHTERACSLCKKSDDCPDIYGEMVTLEEHNLTAHYFCLLMASGMSQRGKENEGIHGFLVGDIKKEIQRSLRLRCSFCKDKGASVGCFIKRCAKKFHMPCGLGHEVIFQFKDSFPSFCKKHSPSQSCIFKPSLPLCCSICLDQIEPVLSYCVLKCPACHGSWFHRHCVQKYAHSAAKFFFKCTLCNNKEMFQKEMVRMGIYIPERDASWELEENAYEELLQVYEHCDATRCLSLQGRGKSSQSGYFEILRCTICGSKGTHRKCSRVNLNENDWVCTDCKAVTEETTSVQLPDRVESPLVVKQERKRMLKTISDINSTLVPKRLCMLASSSEVLMDLASQISQQQSTEVLLGQNDGVMEAALRVLRQSNFNPSSTLSVKFSRDKINNNTKNQRCFLRQLVLKLQMSDIFEGPDGAKNLALNSKALRDDLYFEVGSLLALSLVHGGPPLGFFSPALYHGLFNYPTDYKPTLQDLEETAFGQKLKRIAESKTLKGLQHAMQSVSQYLEAAGCWRTVSELSEKDLLVEDVLNFYLILRLQLPLQRFREGLRTLGLFEKVQTCAESFFSVFCGPMERLTAKSVSELFSVQLSEKSEQRAQEKTATNFWKRYLEECDEGLCAASLEDLLTFTIGTDLVPAIGFKPTPSISFFSPPDPFCAFPQSHWDTNHVLLPLLPSYELFKKHLDYVVCQFAMIQEF